MTLIGFFVATLAWAEVLPNDAQVGGCDSGLADQLTQAAQKIIDKAAAQLK